MQFRIITIPATGDHEAEEDLNRFLRGHRVVSVQKELVQSGTGAYWCFCVEYLDGAKPSADRPKGRSRVDYKDVLSEEEFAIFAKLRDVRKQLATAEAVPVYAVCTNEQLAEMAKGRAVSLSDLKKIDGFGEAKADKYGQSLLATIGETEKTSDETSGQLD